MKQDWVLTKGKVVYKVRNALHVPLKGVEVRVRSRSVWRMFDPLWHQTLQVTEQIQEEGKQ